MSDRPHKRAALACAACVIALGGPGGLNADTNVISVTVSASRVDSALVPGKPDSPSACLELQPNLLLNSQGGASVQTDLSIRGSGFSGAGLSIGGLALRNPQTEHFNAELPVSAAIFSAPEVLTGPTQAAATEGHLVGTVNFDLLPVVGRRQVELGWASPERTWQNLLYEEVLSSGPASLRSGLAVFGIREQLEESDYADNDLRRACGGAHLQVLGDGMQADLVFGNQRKEFGARGYYGVSPAYRAEEQLDDTLIYGGAHWRPAGGSKLGFSVSRRTIEDDYRLFLDPDPYVNHHDSVVNSAAGFGEHALSRSFSIGWRIASDGEELRSARLGDHTRRSAYAALIPRFDHGGARLTGGARLARFEDEPTVILPVASLELELGGGIVGSCSYAESARQPSFTELNYESPGSLGNEGLGSQESAQLETGLRWSDDKRIECGACLFSRRSANAVDWVKKTSDAPRWEAVNLGRVAARGLELDAAYSVGPWARVRLAYEWLDKEHDADFYASRYELDFPEHLLKIAASCRITPRWELTAAQAIRHQAPNPLRSGGESGADGAVALRWLAAREDGLELTLGMDKMWGDDFETMPGQKASPRRTSASVTIHF